MWIKHGERLFNTDCCCSINIYVHEIVFTQYASDDDASMVCIQCQDEEEAKSALKEIAAALAQGVRFLDLDEV